MNDKNTIRRLTLKILFNHRRSKGMTAQDITTEIQTFDPKVTPTEVFSALSFWAKQDCVSVSQADYKRGITALKILAKGGLNWRKPPVPIKYFLSGRAKLITSVFSK